MTNLDFLPTHTDLKTEPQLTGLDYWREVYNSGPRPDPLTFARYYAIMAARMIRQDYKVFESVMHDSIHPSLLREGRKSAVSGSFKEVPRLSPDEIDPDQIKQMLAQGPIPLVFEGLAKDSEAMQHWTPTFFKENYGDTQVCIDSLEEKNIGAKITLAEVVDEILSGKEGGRYVQNIADIFNDNPELEAQLPLEFFDRRLGTVGDLVGIHLFLGGRGSGTPYHCAGGVNLFFNIYGEKEWFFVSPRSTPWMYGQMHYTGTYSFSPIDHNQTPEAQSDKYPLYSQVVVYRTHLRPGDVLINPPWWWHAVNNLTPETISCASRWLGIPKVRATNPLYTIISLLSPYQPFKKFAKDYFLSGGRFKRFITDQLYRDTYTGNHPSDS